MKYIASSSPICLVDTDGTPLLNEKGQLHPPMTFERWAALLFARNDLFSFCDNLVAYDLRARLCAPCEGVREIDDAAHALALQLATRPLGINPMVALQCAPHERALRSASDAKP